MSWFSKSINSDRDDSNIHSQEWPPKFQSFDNYKKELETAINEHPPFGIWLKKYRNTEHLLYGRHDNRTMWSLNIDKLKEQYIKSAKDQNTQRNAKRMFAELYLTEKKYSEAEQTHEEAFRMYKLALEEYDNKAKHGYAYGSRPCAPQENRILCEKKGLESVIQSCVDDLPCVD